MHLRELHDAVAAARWLRELVRGTLHSDSRAVRPGDGFIAWPGQRHDARRFVAAALQAGAAACLVEGAGAEAFEFDDKRIAALPSLAVQAGPVADAFFGQPSRSLDLLATTGTNGKTSTSWWLAHALSLLGRRCAVIGTLGAGEPYAVDNGGELLATGLTTPDAVALQRALHGFVDGGVRACAIEASSIGLAQQRLAGCHIRVALFSNLTQDHLDQHGTMAAYWAAKRALFDWPGLRAAVVNVDDAHGRRLADELRGTPLALWTCSSRGDAADLRASGIRHEAAGLAFELHEGANRHAVRSRLIGDFNVANLLLVVGGLRALGIPLDDAVHTLALLEPVPGRMQRVPSPAPDSPDVVVDYAHTADALDKARRALRPFAAARGGRLWCVFGCGGNRDAGKRAPMGAVAQRLAEQVVLTSDNPRDERPAEILAQIATGMHAGAPTLIIEDRRSAIVYALRQARSGDVVLLAGKGHENTQEIAGSKRAFSDVAEAEAALRQRTGGRP
jgi:UDP-N-acetylmuramoyl-L-alanyl-D-glutamate--2,6-diaminopimelate ligase